MLLIILSAILARDVYAAYNRHNGSTYSCNEINAERAYAKNHNSPILVSKLTAELDIYCPGYENE